jgi:hypothetical protein
MRDNGLQPRHARGFVLGDVFALIGGQVESRVPGEDFGMFVVDLAQFGEELLNLVGFVSQQCSA